VSCASALLAEGYKLPPKPIVDAVDAATSPEAVVSPARDRMLLVEYEANPPLEAVARPMLRLAGTRIDPGLAAERRTWRAIGLSVQPFDGTPARRVAMPAGSRFGSFEWSPDGRRFAFLVDREGGCELWVGDAAAATARAIPGVRANDVLGRTLGWARDGRRLLVSTIPASRGAAPAEPAVPSGPVVEETAGRKSQMATFEDLLRDAHDGDLFEHYSTSQLAFVDPETGAASPVGSPGLVVSAEESPDGQWLLVERLHRPFSTRVPFELFARVTEVWDASGRVAATIADLPPSEEVPRQGVPTGPRSVEWQPLRPATLFWVEALDGGDPARKAPQRDRLMSLAAPFTGARRQVRLVQHRFRRLDWTGTPDKALLVERDRDRRWETTLRVDLSAAADPARDRVLFDRSVNDAYANPGLPVFETRGNGDRVALQDGDSIYLSGIGASEAGDRPFLDRLDLATGKTERLFRSDESAYETFVAFAAGKTPGERSAIVTRRETPRDPPNYFVAEIPSGGRKPRALTSYRDPAPGVSRLQKQLVRYARKDGVPLSGTLYLPADWKPGTRLPVLVWAYPLEYSDTGTAGQVRGSTKTFTRPTGPSPVLLALAGYAVLNDATMPVVGDPETVNNTYLEQIADAARAAIDKLEAMGVADRSRVAIGGHSYGAFMTANLLAHTDLFAAGIARSGAYNRSLTPFGFQNERRSYWEATDLYTKISPFTFAHKIQKPILLIHGEADDNSGTFPIQSERLYRAIQGNGGTARLVLLPHEAHAYRARESVLETLAEMTEWLDRWVKK
jgi:dipeptidyl aminopeptidase/acylaminoacyl peptidase